MNSKTSGLYCQYVEGLCPETRVAAPHECIFFGYPSLPETSADAIKKSIELVRNESSLHVQVVDWQDLPIEGNLIFCEICKAIRQSNCVVLNTTYINFNVLFEYGFAVGAGRAVWPLVEAGIAREDLTYSRIQTLTTIGYSQFINGISIFKKLIRKRPWSRTSHFSLPEVMGEEPSREAIGLLYLKSPHNNEPSLRISETLSQLPIELIIDDPSEVAFQPLPWYIRRLEKAYAVVIHLGSGRIENANIHWAKCALVAGMALALGRRLLMIAEDVTLQPIDYRDLLMNYKNATQAEKIVREFSSKILREVEEYRAYIEHDIKPPRKRADNILENIELGEYVAENELQSLRTYFVETPEFLSALEPKFQVFVGKKGSGKTANFYMIRDKLLEDKRNIVCLIKPKEYELNELLQFVKKELDIAKKGYLLESLWKFMLYSEAIKSSFQRIKEKPNQEILSQGEKAIENYVKDRMPLFEQSFTSRLVQTVKEVCQPITNSHNFEVAISEVLHTKEIGQMHRMLCEYVAGNIRHFAVLVDGLDANWHLGRDYEIMSGILLALIGCARDVWRDCRSELGKSKATKGVSLLIFVRSDVFKVALQLARDPDKLQYDMIFWPSVESLIKIIESRLLASLDNYDNTLNWADFLEPGFSPQDMKTILANNILLRPRDIIYYFQRVLYYSRTRGTKYITKRDFASALREYSQYALMSLSAESQPFIPNMLDLLVEFSESSPVLTVDEISSFMLNAGIRERNIRKALSFLIESNFLGYGIDDFNYRFPTSPTDDAIMLRRALRHWGKDAKVRKFKIHNAFHEILAIH